MIALRLAAAALLLAGCATFVPEGEVVPASLYAASYRATDLLAASAEGELDRGKPLIIATLVDIDDLERSSTLGRFLSESVSTRLTQNRFRMVELKLQGAVYMKSGEGELLLTRQIREVASSHQAQAVVVGTYSRGRSAVFVNVKIVRPDGNLVLAAQDFSLPMSRDVCAMIHRDPRPCAEYD